METKINKQKFKHQNFSPSGEIGLLSDYDIRIRSARFNDINNIKALSAKYNFEPNRNWNQLYLDKDVEIYTITNKGNFIGFTGLIHQNWNRTLQILDIFINPHLRKMGIGGIAINFLLNRAKRMNNYRCIIVEAPAKDGIDKFYAKFGFRKCGYNDRYYTNNNDGNIAIFMSYDLH